MCWSQGAFQGSTSLWAGLHPGLSSLDHQLASKFAIPPEELTNPFEEASICGARGGEARAHSGRSVATSTVAGGPYTAVLGAMIKHHAAPNNKYAVSKRSFL